MEKQFKDIGSEKKIYQEVPKNLDEWSFDHIDFMYSANLKEYLYDDLFEVLDKDFT